VTRTAARERVVSRAIPTLALTDTMTTLAMTGPTWDAWRTLAKVLDGLPLDATERALFESRAGRSRVPPPEEIAELVVIAGRRAGKSRFASACVVQRAGYTEYTLAPGEVATVAVAGSDREQARVLLGYCLAPFTEQAALRDVVKPPSAWTALRGLVSRETRWGIDLRTGVTIQVSTAHFGRIRGRSFAGAVADEVSFWSSDDGSNPASEVLAAIRPGLVTLGGRLIVISSPYAKSGPLWDAYTRHFGKDDDPVLVWRAPSRTMNPGIPQSIIDAALERDEASARAEWLAEFRDDVSGLLTSDLLARVVIQGRQQLDRQLECDYIVFVDAASGAGQDSMTLAVAHGEEYGDDGRVVAVLDHLHERRPPFDPHAVAREFAGLARAYGCDRVVGDKFAYGWVGAAFERAGVRYEPSEFTRSDCYLRLLTGITSRRVELLDHPRLLQQLTALQRRPGAGGRESVDHPNTVGAHDDVANAAAGALAIILDAADRPPLFFR
jgi:hypothetical protein